MRSIHSFIHPSFYSLTHSSPTPCRAQGHWDEFGLGNGEVVQFSWDDKRAGVFVSTYSLSLISLVIFEALGVIVV